MLKSTRTANRAGAVVQNILSWLRTGDNALRAAVVVAYALLVLFGATTSSLGMNHLRQDPDNPLGSQLGLPNWIRSDEYNANTPIALSIMATGGAPTLSVLGARADLVQRFSSGGFFESFIFFDSGLLKLAAFLPDASVFAACWWLPMLLLFLMMPKWMEQMGGSRRMGWLAAGLIALSPSVAWWSMMPVSLIAYTLTGSSLMISAYHRLNRRQWTTGVIAGVVGGILIAGMPSFYIPWSLILGLSVLVASTLWILCQAGRLWCRVRPVLLSGITAVVFGVGLLLENTEGLTALMNTVYPGARRSSAEAQPISLLLGAPALSPLQNGEVPIQANASEISTSFTIAFVVIAVLLAGSRLVPTLRKGVAAWTMLAFGLVWLGWTLVDLGSLGENIPLLNLVPSVRAAQVVGILGIIALCLLLPMVGPQRWKTASVSAVLAGGITVYAASRVQSEYLPDMRFLNIAAAGLGVALCTLLLTRFATQGWPVLLTVLLAAVPVYKANPLVFGLGDLRESESAVRMHQEGIEARAEGTLWASNVGSFDTLSLANGVPTLSGLQRSGPNMDMWLRLDPDKEFEEAWNRGGGYLPFVWTPGEETNIRTDGFDLSFVEIDPCVLAAAMPELGHVASSYELTDECLRSEETLVWGGNPIHIYEVLRD